MAPGDDSTQRGLDDALKASFPASDPPAATTPAIATVPSGSAEQAASTIAHVYRVIERSEAAAPFASEANRSGGRWSSPGIPAIYASSTPAGAVLEFLAHLDGDRPADLVLLSARMPERSIVNGTSLPAAWRETPYRDDVREYGNAWLDGREALALSLPSVLCEASRNLLINPAHPDIGQLMVESTDVFTLDPRLVRR